MKMLTFALMSAVLSFHVSANSANAAQICVAELYQFVNYSSYNQYVVTCDDGKTFETKKNVTTFLLPLPYAWKKVAKQNLDKAMKKLGLQEAVSIRPQVDRSASFTPLLVYAKPEVIQSKALEPVVMVFPANARKTGIQGETLRLDAVLAHSDGRKDTVLSGVTEEELSKVLADSGFKTKRLTGILKSTYSQMYTREISMSEFRLFTR